MKKFFLAIAVLSGAVVIFVPYSGTALQVSRTVPGRYDQQIRHELARILHKAEYKNAKAKVEDSVVTLSGSVELDSTRRSLVERVRKVPHVEAVENRLVLDPPAPDDKALYGRVQRNLADAGFESLKLKVHEGAVTVEGAVADQKQRQRVIDLVKRTEGVKEVDARLSFATR
jgi:osmotically-inducible protein OsmY